MTPRLRAIIEQSATLQSLTPVELGELARWALNAATTRARRSISYGQLVQFETRDGRTLRGRVYDKAIKTMKVHECVDATDGTPVPGKWTVSSALLTPVEA